MVPERIRNVALVGHGGSGKTSLAEALLFTAGETTRLGRTEDGNTVTDFEPEEIERKLSLGLSLASLPWKGYKITLIDTPGYADFVGDARSALRAADLALFVVSGVDGVEVQTEAMWHMAGEEGLPRIIFINKLDRERSSFSLTLDALREAFGKGVAPVQVPIGTEAELSGLVRVVSNTAVTYTDGNPKGTPTQAPESMEETMSKMHMALVESVVETDDELLEAYFEGVEPDRAKIVEVTRQGILTGDIQPVLCGSSTRLIGIDTLAEFLTEFGPSPLERPPVPLEGGGSLAITTDGDPVAYVFKTTSDPYVGRISLLRVFSGTVHADDNLETSSGERVRVHNLFFMQGKEHKDASELVTGDIAAVAKVENLRGGETLHMPGTKITIQRVAMPKPVMSVVVSPQSAQDEEKLSTALARIVEEDPTLQVDRRSETKETVLSGLGDTHLDVTIARLSRKFGVKVDTSIPKIPYRETIGAKAEAEGKHKKQSGGRGQFGVAFLRFEPLPRGAGYEFVNAIKGGSIPRQYIPAVDKGVREGLERGILAGYPVTDVKATVYDGKYHSVDSDELSFRMAGILAVRAAAKDLRPTLLEPIVRVDIRVPEDYMGDVIGDLNAKRGRVLGMDSEGHFRIVTAEVPLAEMQRYAIDLRSMTGGRGSFEMTFDHYEEVPRQEAQKIIASAQKEEA
ncbi:MAG: elongation factor G [Gammaproteobacteria bacterium]|nr:elongation factor G [Gammaproteobacteria bacterium]